MSDISIILVILVADATWGHKGKEKGIKICLLF